PPQLSTLIIFKKNERTPFSHSDTFFPLGLLPPAHGGPFSMSPDLCYGIEVIPSMAKFTLDITDEKVVNIFNDSMAYEILYTLGVPLYDIWDYSRWEYINFARATHARLL